MTDDEDSQVIDFENAGVRVKAAFWQSFWDAASPEKAARLLFDTYGADAATAAAHCGLAADGDKRPDDVRFWPAVFKLLKPPETGRQTSTPDGRVQGEP